MVARQFSGWSPAGCFGRSPANCWVCRPPALGVGTRQSSGRSPTSSRVGRPPVRGMTTRALAMRPLASPCLGRPPMFRGSPAKSWAGRGWSPANPCRPAAIPKPPGARPKEKAHAAVVARQLLGWSPANSGDGRPPIPGMVAHQFSGWSTPSRSLTQALQTYIDLTQACANKTPAPTHANCDAPLARRLKNPKLRIANTDVSNTTALTDTNIAKLHCSDSGVCEKNARLDTRELRCPPPPPTINVEPVVPPSACGVCEINARLCKTHRARMLHH